MLGPFGSSLLFVPAHILCFRPERVRAQSPDQLSELPCSSTFAGRLLQNMEVHVHMFSGMSFAVTVDPADYIALLKLKIDDITYIRPECQLLFSGDTLLKDLMFVKEHIRSAPTINLVVQ